jgi:hypothetical protein
VIDERGLGRAWDEMLVSLRAAADRAPWVVTNAALDSQTRPTI